MRLFALAALALFATAAAPPAPQAPVYHVTRRYVLGGEGGWDYLTFDPQRKRLFISRSTRVMVVDPSNGELAGTIAGTPGVHGIALAPDLGKGFTSNGRDGTVSVFDLNTLQKVATIQTGAKNPDCIIYDPATKRVFTFNGGSDDATAIDAATDAVIATIPLGGRPEFAVADGKGRIYDNLEDKNAMAVIDPQKAAVVATWRMDPCRSPSGLSMDRQNRVLFAACEGQMAMIDADGGKVIATVPTGKGTDATAFYPGENLAFAPNGRDATLTVVASSALKRFSVLENVKTEVGARTMALDPSSGEVFLVTAQLKIDPDATSYRERYRAVPGTFTLLVLGP